MENRCAQAESHGILQELSCTSGRTNYLAIGRAVVEIRQDGMLSPWSTAIAPHHDTRAGCHPALCDREKATGALTPPHPPVQETVNDQKLMEPTPGVAPSDASQLPVGPLAQRSSVKQQPTRCSRNPPGEWQKSAEPSPVVHCMQPPPPPPPSRQTANLAANQSVARFTRLGGRDQNF